MTPEHWLAGWRRSRKARKKKPARPRNPPRIIPAKGQRPLYEAIPTKKEIQWMRYQRRNQQIEEAFLRRTKEINDALRSPRGVPLHSEQNPKKRDNKK